jgi:cobyric acid synthase
MLGRTISDPDGIEGPAGETDGLDLLDVDTVMTADKRLTRTEATHAASGAPIQGYEIHIGQTTGEARARPFAHVAGEAEGAVSADGRVMGSYLHGMFSGDSFRRRHPRRPMRPASKTRWIGWPRISRRIWTSMGCWRSRAKGGQKQKSRKQPHAK